MNAKTVGAVLVVVASLVATAMIVTAGSSSVSSVDTVTTETWPVRISYDTTGPATPQLEAERVTTRSVFEGYGWHSWRDAEVGLDGGCKMRFEDQLLISDDGCRSAAFKDEYGLKVGQGFGANQYLRLNGGLSQEAVADGESSAEFGLGAVVADSLAVDPASISVISSDSVVPCRTVGLDCERKATETLTRIVHQPTGILLQETSTFDGQELYGFRVESIEFGATDLPEQLNP